MISGDITEELAAGDSAHYPADVPHQIANPSDKPVEAFLVVIYQTDVAAAGTGERQLRNDA